MAAGPDELLAHLRGLGIEVATHDHAPVFTVEESKRLRGALPGGHCKSLFLKDKGASLETGRLWLVVALEDRAVDLKRLKRALGAKSLSFASPELLMALLGVIPGAVTPFGAINDQAGRVEIVLDRAMLERDLLNYHPLTNARTSAIAPQGLLRFLRANGHEPQILDFEALAAAEGGQEAAEILAPATGLPERP
jgi:Ala-tRNA(Pro) deacylase